MASSLIIETPGSRVSLKSARLKITIPATEAAGSGDPGAEERPAETIELRLGELERVVIGEQVQITTQALAELMRRGLPLLVATANGRPIGSLLPADADRYAATRLLQYQRSLEPEFCLEFSQAVISAKIRNQRRILQKLDSNRPGQIGRPKLPILNRLAEAAEQAEDLRALRGIEGTAARRYFSVWARFLPDDFPFEFRSKRPPLNPVNACLSYAAVVVYREIEACLWQRGLDPGLACLHVSADDRASLALDLIEPFRPSLVEALTMYLFGRGILQREDFEPHAEGVYLSRSGREKFHRHYERRVERRFFHKPCDARATFRQQFIAAALAFKGALQLPLGSDTGDRFAAFRLA